MIAFEFCCFNLGRAGSLYCVENFILDVCLLLIYNILLALILEGVDGTTQI